MDIKIFNSLKLKVLGEIEAYHDDLLVHDKQEILDLPNDTKIIHLTRTCGTWMIALNPSEQFPKKGETVKFLFGTADREHIIDSKMDMLKTAWKNNADTTTSIHYYNGKSWERIYYTKAEDILEDYIYYMKRKWSME